MSEYKEFKAKDLDQAIETACKHFKVGREKLEIEILSGGSSGIFGLVGKKQATVRARLRQPAGAKRPVLESPLDGPADTSAARPEAQPEAKADEPAAEDKAEAPAQDAETSEAKPKRSRRSRGRRRGKAKAESAPGETVPNGPENGPEAAPAEAGAAEEDKGGQLQPRQESRPARRERPAPPAKVEAKPEPAAPREAAPEQAEGEAPQPRESQPAESQEDIQALAKDVVARLIRPMLPELPPLEVEAEPGRVKVHIDDEEHSGLIIGHQGQTIAALQYLANRIIARKAKGNVRIHLDAGDYREKQDDNLRQLALSLADKAKSQGKMQSTRPLSSYHRRLVHLALQNDESITTRSKGEGPMKRVLILPRRERQPQQQ